MEKSILICDGCGTDVGVRAYKVDWGCEMDPSGNGYNTIWHYTDRCDKCKALYALGHPDKKIKPRI